MKDAAKTWRIRVQLGAIICFCLAAASSWAIFPSNAASLAAADMPATEMLDSELFEPAQDFSKFTHSSAQHARMPCLLCHERAVGRTTPKMPGHMPCAGCHVQQFADNQNKMCTICHTATSVKRFPPLRSFNVKFDHGQHLRQTSCATCHKPSRQGVALSVPSGPSAHASCFGCHGPRTEIGGRNIGSCATCHQPGRPTRASDWSRAYNVNFNHAEHRNANCATCHTVLRGSARGRQVTAPLVSMHFAPAGRASCNNCHNNKRAFGVDDGFTNCKRCHEGRTFK
jgi:c(7)-type cytochrome triheme protein